MATKWIRLRFRLTGSLHVGSSRWGYVRRGRPYLPGWTLWGALTNFCKRNGKITRVDTFTDVGNYLDENFWFSHLGLVHPGTDGDAFFLPALDPANGRTIYQWRSGNKTVTGRVPLAFRAGVARGRPDNDPLGRHFLTEAIGSNELDPYFLEGWYLAVNDVSLPLKIGDRLPVGGNRQTSGAVITLETHEKIDDVPDLQRLSHVQLPEDGEFQVTGDVERLVMRRTREGEGFGKYFIDWGRHAVPGWQVITDGIDIQPARENGNYHHGTVTLERRGRKC